jgi:hypothetical protein
MFLFSSLADFRPFFKSSSRVEAGSVANGFSPFGNARAPGFLFGIASPPERFISSNPIGKYTGFLEPAKNRPLPFTPAALDWLSWCYNQHFLKMSLLKITLVSRFSSDVHETPYVHGNMNMSKFVNIGSY